MKNLFPSFLLAVVTLGSLSGHAEESGESKRIRVIKGPASGAAEIKAPSALLAPLITDDQKVNGFQFGPEADVRDLLGMYQRLTGQHVIYSNQVVGPCQLVVNESIPVEKALSLLEKALFANGFTLIDLRDGTLQVTGIGQSPAGFPIPVFTKLDDLPKRERIAKMVFKIKYRDVTELAQQMISAYPPAPFMGGLTCIPDPQSKTLVVTERTGTIREIAKLIEQLDVPAPGKLVKNKPGKK